MAACSIRSVLPISDAGLAKLEGLKKLRTLELRKTNATKAGVDKLQKALPDAKIRF